MNKREELDFMSYFAKTSNKEINMLKSTIGNNKIWNYFVDLVKNNSFDRSVKNIREISLTKNGKIKDEIKFRNRTKQLCRRFGLDEISWGEDIRTYILKNKLPKDSLSNSCVVLDRTEVGEDEYPNGDYIEGDFGETDQLKDPIELKPVSYSYPVIIRVSPYASQREIVDFIKKSYNQYIQPIQDRYKDKELNLGKVRKKKVSIKERNDFIYENRHLPDREIMTLVYDKFGEQANIDYGCIGKIISLEDKKREN
jgi:hypothetical protein